MLVLTLSHTRFRILANTRDEAVGRAIDKVARDLGLEWKGRAPGAALEAFCRDGDGTAELESGELPVIEPFSVPLRGKLDFSFSGLHSAVDRYIALHGFTDDDVNMGKANPKPRKANLPNAHRLSLARAFQDGAFAQLVDKVILALRRCEEHPELMARPDENQSLTTPTPIRHLVVSGGVASNSTFRNL